MKKISLFFLIAILVITLLFCLKLFINQKNFISEAKNTNNPIKAIRYYERVILSYIPFSPYNKGAIKGILGKCKSLEDTEQKLYCYETLRSDLYQIKSFYQPYKEEIEKLEPLIAELKSKQMIQWKYNNFSEKDYQSLYNYHIKILRYDASPSVMWSIISVFSLLGWIGSVFLIIFKGLGRLLNKRYLLIGFITFIIFFVLWVLSLYLA